MRNRYLDLLRAAAIVRVIIYHLFGWPWLSIVLPAMGIMFALAGSLTAASLDRRGPGRVVASRLRRLLPPLWLLGLLTVPLMLVLGWAHESGEVPFSPVRLLLWLVPVGDPPGSDKLIDVWEPLWYIRAYLWFVVLSPVMYLAYRKAGWAAVAAPLVLIAVLDQTGFSLPDLADAAMWDFATYAACWMAGFAHHDGRLARTRPALVVGAAVVLGVAAMYWLKGHPGEDGYDLNDVTESQALWSLAFVLVVLRWQPRMEWLGRVRPLDRAVTLLNGRAVTIYLWHNIAIAAVWPVLTYVALDDLGALDGTVDLVTALVLTGVAVLAFGWAEDLAARRRPRLLPITDVPRLVPAGAGPAAGGAAAGSGPADAVGGPAAEGATAGGAAAGGAAAGGATAGGAAAGSGPADDRSGPADDRSGPTDDRAARGTGAMPHQRAAEPEPAQPAGAAVSGRSAAALTEPTLASPALLAPTTENPALLAPTTASSALLAPTLANPVLPGDGSVQRPVVEFGLPAGPMAGRAGHRWATGQNFAAGQAFVPSQSPPGGHSAAAVHGPAVHGPAVHGPAVHGPAVHGPGRAASGPMASGGAVARDVVAAGGAPDGDQRQGGEQGGMQDGEPDDAPWFGGDPERG